MATTMRTARRINVAALTVDPVSTRRSTRQSVAIDVAELLERPRDPDDLVAALRHAIAWRIEGGETVAELGGRADVRVARLVAFMQAPARVAGELLTVGEVGRLARALDERLVDRDLEEQYRDAWRLASIYLEVESADGLEGAYRRALRTARQVRRDHRARHPGADRFADV